jgi:hypothetical protein
MTPGPISIRQAAALYVSMLERRGAVFTLDEDDIWHVDLNGCEDIGSEHEAADTAHTLFLMKDEIRAVLVAQRVQH